MSDHFLAGRYELELNRPLIMGIINITPDSFSDGGQHASLDAALAHARQLIAEGADILDLGGESTRPGAPPVTLETECQRVLPLIEGLRNLNVPLSIDSYKPEVMRAALDAGADMLNDIRGFTDAAAIAVAASHVRCGLIAMHMLGEPRTMQTAEPVYGDVVGEVSAWLAARARALEAAGVERRRIMLDPGLGFGKTVTHNYTLLARLPELRACGYPLLVGASRKSMIGAVTGQPVDHRLAGSVAAALAAATRGAAVLRVHDVAATRDALRVWQTTASFNTSAS